MKYIEIECLSMSSVEFVSYVGTMLTVAYII